jgi:exonuclease VII large subunit
LIAELTQREHRLFERIERRLEVMRHLVNDAPQMMVARFDAAVVEHKRRLHHAIRELKHLDPKVVLRRGYALVRHEDKLVKGAAKGIKIGDGLTITLARAILKAEVTHVEHKTEEA